jgi:sulfatase maturation enzyme AslB (radical SAM superfamily)
MENKEELSKEMTPEALEEIAKMLDTYDKLSLEFLVPYLRGEKLSPDMGDSWNKGFADKLEVWSSGDTVQRDLRKWASELDSMPECNYDCSYCNP